MSPLKHVAVDYVGTCVVSLVPLQRDVLPDEARHLVRLLGLQPRDALLQQRAALHVQEQRAVLRADLTNYVLSITCVEDIWFLKTVYFF